MNEQTGQKKLRMRTKRKICTECRRVICKYKWWWGVQGSIGKRTTSSEMWTYAHNGDVRDISSKTWRTWKGYGMHMLWSDDIYFSYQDSRTERPTFMQPRLKHDASVLLIENRHLQKLTCHRNNKVKRYKPIKFMIYNHSHGQRIVETHIKPSK